MVDDIPLLIEQMRKMGLVEILDNNIPRHWKQRNLSWGWTAMIWLAYIYRYGDHRKLAMEKYVEGMQSTLSSLVGQKIEALDVSSDRLACLLKNLANSKYWDKIEAELNERTIKVYDLETETIRCDATTVSCNHNIEPEGLIQFGHSKDDLRSPQFKLMMGSFSNIRNAFSY
jgi:transposase